MQLLTRKDEKMWMLIGHELLPFELFGSNYGAMDCWLMIMNKLEF